MAHCFSSFLFPLYERKAPQVPKSPPNKICSAGLCNLVFIFYVPANPSRALAPHRDEDSSRNGFSGSCPASAHPAQRSLFLWCDCSQQIVIDPKKVQTPEKSPAACASVPSSIPLSQTRKSPANPPPLPRRRADRAPRVSWCVVLVPMRH